MELARAPLPPSVPKRPPLDSQRFVRRCSFHHRALVRDSLYCPTHAPDPHRCLAWEVYDREEKRVVAIGTKERILLIEEFGEVYALVRGLTAVIAHRGRGRDFGPRSRAATG